MENPPETSKLSRRQFIKLAGAGFVVAAAAAINTRCRPYGKKDVAVSPVTPETAFERKWRERIKNISQRIVIPDGFWYNSNPAEAFKNSQRMYYPELGDNRDASGNLIAIDFDRPDHLKPFFDYFEGIDIHENEDPLITLTKISRRYKEIKPTMPMKNGFGQTCVGAAKDSFTAISGLTDIKTVFVSVVEVPIKQGKSKLPGTAIHLVLATPINGDWYIIDNESSVNPVILPMAEYFTYLNKARNWWITDRNHLALAINGDPFNLSAQKPPWLLLPPALHPLPKR